MALPHSNRVEKGGRVVFVGRYFRQRYGDTSVHCEALVVDLYL